MLSSTFTLFTYSVESVPRFVNLSSLIVGQIILFIHVHLEEFLSCESIYMHTVIKQAMGTELSLGGTHTNPPSQSVPESAVLVLALCLRDGDQSKHLPNFKNVH